MRISDWSSDVCSSDLPSDAQRKCDPIRPSLLANLFWRANQSAPSPGPSMFTRPLSIAALSQTAPYDTFLFRSAARPVLMAATARSEEHTSELQSLMRISYAVFCLKKKKIHKIKQYRVSHIIK